VHDGAVGDRELALLPREELELLFALAVLGAHGRPAGREVDGGDLAERRRGRQHDRRGAACHRQRGDDARAVHDRSRVAAAVADDVEVRVATVADAERDRRPVAGPLRRPAGIGRPAGHHVAVERS
jgi:hypothetical protein